MVRHEIENHIAALPRLGEILMGLIDEAICAYV
jgi:hypothetical protein